MLSCNGITLNYAVILYDKSRSDNLQNFVSPIRYSWLTAFAGKYVNEWVTLSASALATVINEKAKNGGSAYD